MFLAKGKDRYNVRVAQRLHQHGFLLEALAVLAVFAVLRQQNFERYRFRKAKLRRLVDRSHATFSQLFLDDKSPNLSARGKLLRSGLPELVEHGCDPITRHWLRIECGTRLEYVIRRISPSII